MARGTKSNNDNVFAAVLVRLMNERMVTIEELSEACDIPFGTIYYWPLGVNPASQKQVGRICRYFGVSRDYMYEGDEGDEDAQAKIAELNKKLIAAQRDAAIWKVQTTFLEDTVKEQKEEIKRLRAV